MQTHKCALTMLLILLIALGHKRSPRHPAAAGPKLFRKGRRLAP